MDHIKFGGIEVTTSSVYRGEKKLEMNFSPMRTVGEICVNFGYSTYMH